MKFLCLLLLLLLARPSLDAQIMLRNDFVINKKLTHWQNKGITHVTVGVGPRHVWNLNAYGQPARAITVDVSALLAKKHYSYRETIERIYAPRAVYRRSYIPIPLFLLLEPQRRLRAAFNGRSLRD